MKVNMTKEVTEENSLISHIVIEGLTSAKIDMDKFVRGKRKGRGKKQYIEFDVKVLVDNKEINLKSFVNHWQSQVARMIKEEAEKMIVARFTDLSDLLSDLEERVKEEINKRLEDWEKEQK